MCPAFLAACASSAPPPTTAVQQAGYAVQQADRVNANRYAKQPWLHAHEELDQAKHLVNSQNATRQDYDEARRLAKRAEVDARLAKTQSEAMQAQAQASDVKAENKQLSKELNLNSSQ